MGPKLVGRMLMALLGIMLLGGLMIVILMFLGRWFRRQTSIPLSRTEPYSQPWYSKPLVPGEKSPKAKTSLQSDSKKVEDSEEDSDGEEWKQGGMPDDEE